MKSVAAESALKHDLATTILAGIQAEYPSLREAADAADISFDMLYRLSSRHQSGVYRDISIGWLLGVAKQAGINLKVSVSLL